MVRPLDTTPDASRRQAAIFRRMSGAERVEMALRMSEMVRELTAAGIRHRHPDWTDEQVREALLEHLHGRQIAAQIRRSRLARA